MQISGGGTSSLTPIARPQPLDAAREVVRPTPTSPLSPQPPVWKGDRDGTAKTSELAKAAVALSETPRFAQAAGKNTCAAANHERNVLEKAPELHARMLKELKRDGHTTMPNGQELHLSEKNAEYIDQQPCSEEEKGAMRIQAAMMDYANRHQPYDLEHDVSGADQQGLTVEEAQRLDALDDSCKTVSNQQIQGAAMIDTAIGAVSTLVSFGLQPQLETHEDRVVNQVSNQLEQIADQDRNLIMNLQLAGDDMMHSVRIEGVTDDGSVVISDTTGRQTLDAAEFAEAAQSDDGNVGDDTTMSTTTTAPAPTGGGVRRR